MKYLYYYIWCVSAFLHYQISKFFSPINKLVRKLTGKTDADYENWRNDYNKGFLSFPGGIIDWFAFGALCMLFFTPIFILTIIFVIDIYTNKVYFLSIFISITAMCYYIIYYRNIAWLKERINRVNKNYFIK